MGVFFWLKVWLSQVGDGLLLDLSFLIFGLWGFVLALVSLLVSDYSRFELLSLSLSFPSLLLVLELELVLLIPLLLLVCTLMNWLMCSLIVRVL